MNTQCGRKLLRAVKASTIPGMPVLSIPVGSPVEAILRPVSTSKGNLNADDVRKLTTWRNRHVKSFLTEFEATESRTGNWLTQIVGPDDTRILFMIDDIFNRTFGYMGLAFIDWEEGYGEADAVVRGDDVAPGTMTRTLKTMLKWAQLQLNIYKIGVRVRSNNTALNFYYKAGFKEIKRVPLSKVEEANMIKWVENELLHQPDLNLVYMIYNTQSHV